MDLERKIAVIQEVRQRLHNWTLSELPPKEENEVMEEREKWAYEKVDEVWKVIRGYGFGLHGAYQDVRPMGRIAKTIKGPSYPCYEASFGSYYQTILPIRMKNKLVEMKWDLSGEMSVFFYKPPFSDIKEPLKEIFSDVPSGLYEVKFKTRSLII